MSNFGMRPRLSKATSGRGGKGAGGAAVGFVPPAFMLTEQYRMHPEIATAVSSSFYRYIQLST